MAAYRFCFTVTGVSKFLSHLDILKLFNRALMRAKLPVAYSEGFNPHPKLSFAPPRGVGIEGLAEWGDLQLKEDVSCAEVLQKLNLALPKSVQLKSVRQMQGEGKTALMAQIKLSCYEAEFVGEEAALAELAAAVEKFKTCDKWEIVRHHPKKGDKQIDLKVGVENIELLGTRLLLEIPFREGGSVKPIEVLQALAPTGVDYKMARVGQYVINANGERQEP